MAYMRYSISTNVVLDAVLMQTEGEHFSSTLDPRTLPAIPRPAVLGYELITQQVHNELQIIPYRFLAKSKRRSESAEDAVSRRYAYVELSIETRIEC